MELGTPVQQALDLHLFLYDRSLHPELFRHHADYRVRQGNYHADLWIVGLSHVVSVCTEHRALTEVIAPEMDVLPSRGVLTRFRMKGERDIERSTTDGWQYMVSSQLEVMDEPLYKSVHTDLERHAQKRGVYCRYEQVPGTDDMFPFSFIDYEARNREFHVHSFHTFPTEFTLVKTQSIFEMPE